jgi:hypothetical protein
MYFDRAQNFVSFSKKLNIVSILLRRTLRFDASSLRDMDPLLQNMFVVSTGKVSLVSALQANTIYPGYADEKSRIWLLISNEQQHKGTFTRTQNVKILLERLRS